MRDIDRIISELKAQGYKQIDLANYLRGKGVTKHTITDWKSGKSTTYYQHIADIADFLNVTTDYLLGRDEEPIRKEKKEMTAEERESLKRLTPMFQQLRKLKVENCINKSPLRYDFEKSGVTLDELREWSQGNFRDPPEEAQLKMLASHFVDDIDTHDEYMRAINDYLFYKKETGVSSGGRGGAKSQSSAV